MQIYKIPDINLTKIDYKVGKEVLIALKNVIEKYPYLASVINCVGDFKYILEQKKITTKRLYNAKTQKNNPKNLYKTASFFTSCCYFDTDDVLKGEVPFYIGIGINEKDSYEKVISMLQMQTVNNISYCSSIKECVYHEAGHILDRLLNLNKSVAFKKNINILMKENKYNYPAYALSSEREFIAECFAKYMTNPNYNEAVNTIGSIIDYLYDYVFNKQNINKNTNEIYKERVLKIMV